MLIAVYLHVDHAKNHKQHVCTCFVKYFRLSRTRIFQNKLQNKPQNKLQDKLQNKLQDRLQSTLLNKLQNTEYVDNDVDVDDQSRAEALNTDCSRFYAK